MKSVNNYLLIFTFVLMSCNSGQQDVIRISNPQYSVITDSIYARLPGDILYQNGLVYWWDPFSGEDFLHVVDVETGKEVTRFGNIGQGPTDFTLPMFSLSPTNGLYVNDTNKDLEILYQWDNQNDSLVMAFDKYENDPNSVRISCIDETTKVLLCPENDRIFNVIKKNAGSIHFGNRPVTDSLINAYDVFQGCLGYNPYRKQLVYSCISFPYIAVYGHNSWTDWTLLSEQKAVQEYRVVENELNFNSDASYGSTEMALTKDYIVLLKFDFEIEDYIKRDEIGTVAAKMPRSLFVYDYELNLEKIINFSFPVIRLCGDPETDTIYAIIVNPEYELIKITL